MAALTLESQHEGGVTVLALDGELDIASVPALRTAALSELADPGCAELALDVANLTFLDSTGLGCWVELRNEAQNRGKNLSLRNVTDAVRRVMTLGGLAELFSLDPLIRPLGDDRGSDVS